MTVEQRQKKGAANPITELARKNSLRKDNMPMTCRTHMCIKAEIIGMEKKESVTQKKR